MPNVPENISWVEDKINKLSPQEIQRKKQERIKSLRETLDLGKDISDKDILAKESKILSLMQDSIKKVEGEVRGFEEGSAEKLVQVFSQGDSYDLDQVLTKIKSYHRDSNPKIKAKIKKEKKTLIKRLFQ
jgi:hypothetical protein